jgi:hypothetical protein
MRVVGLVDFRHSRPLGNEHAHKLFDKVKVEMKDKSKEFPDSIDDYFGSAPDGEVGEKDRKTSITAKRIVWEIPSPENQG